MTPPQDAARAQPDTAGVRLPDGAQELLAGPWQAAFYTVVDGRVRSKSNFRAGRNSSWRDLAGYEDEVYLALRSARPPSWPLLDNDQPEAERPRVVAVLVGRTGLDAGNLSKSILDAAQGVLYVDDAQVASVCDTVERTTRAPGLLIAFAALPAATETVAAMRTQATLLDQITELLGSAP